MKKQFDRFLILMMYSLLTETQDEEDEAVSEEGRNLKTTCGNWVRWMLKDIHGNLIGL